MIGGHQNEKKKSKIRYLHGDAVLSTAAAAAAFGVVLIRFHSGKLPRRELPSESASPSFLRFLLLMFGGALCPRIICYTGTL